MCVAAVDKVLKEVDVDAPFIKILACFSLVEFTGRMYYFEELGVLPLPDELLESLTVQDVFTVGYICRIGYLNAGYGEFGFRRTEAEEADIGFPTFHDVFHYSLYFLKAFVAISSFDCCS